MAAKILFMRQSVSSEDFFEHGRRSKMQMTSVVSGVKTPNCKKVKISMRIFKRIFLLRILDWLKDRCYIYCKYSLTIL